MIMAVTVYRYQDTIADPATGRPVGGVAVTVKLTGTETLATLYDAAGVTAHQPNPVYSDSMGLFSFYIQVGTYDLTCSFGSGTANRSGIFIDGFVDLSGRIIGFTTKALMDADLIQQTL